MLLHEKELNETNEHTIIQSLVPTATSTSTSSTSPTTTSISMSPPLLEVKATLVDGISISAFTQDTGGRNTSSTSTSMSSSMHSALDVSAPLPPSDPASSKREKEHLEMVIRDLDSSNGSSYARPSKKRKVTLLLPSDTMQAPEGGSYSATKNASTSAGANFLMTPSSSGKFAGRTSLINESPISIAVSTAVSSCKDQAKDLAETPMFLLPYFGMLSTSAQRSIIKQLAVTAQKEQRHRNVEKAREEFLSKTPGSSRSASSKGVCNSGTQTPTNFMSHTPLSSRSPLKLFSSPGAGDAFADMDFVELFSDPSGSLSLFDEEVEEGGAAASEVGGVTDEQLELMEPLVPISDAAVEKGRLKILHQLNKAKERS